MEGFTSENRGLGHYLSENSSAFKSFPLDIYLLPSFFISLSLSLSFFIRKVLTVEMFEIC